MTVFIETRSIAHVVGYDSQTRTWLPVCGQRRVAGASDRRSTSDGSPTVPWCRRCKHHLLWRVFYWVSSGVITLGDIRDFIRNPND